MNADAASPGEESRERRLHEILADYYREAGDGPEPDCGPWLDRHPEFAPLLAEFFAEQDRFRRLAGPLRQASGCASSVADTIRYVGDYELIREIARGGMGVIFEARQRSLNRPVALKMILSGALASADSRQRFRREAEAAAGLDHPCIVPIYEVGEHDGRSYFSMKMVEGGSLAERVAEFADDPRSAARLLAAVARAVHHAHRRGVLHRDLKPSNVLLDDARRPYVTDFGLARSIAGDVELTGSGAILGTPAYMAPEQTTGRKGVVTVATDVYGLGAVLYALLTGRPPFRGESALETIEQVRAREPEPPSRTNRRAGRDLETICLKCLEKDPARRYASAEALADDLDRWLRGEPTAARPVGRLESAWRWCRRNPSLAGLAGAAAVLLAVAVVVPTLAYLRIAREQEETRRAQRIVDVNAHYVLHGITEPLKKLANPELARNPEFVELRREIVERAIGSLQAYTKETVDDPNTWIHIGLLSTVIDDHPRARRAYRRAVSAARVLTERSPADSGGWDQLGQAYVHLGMDLWQQGRRADANEPFAAAASSLRKGSALGPENIYALCHEAWFLTLCPDTGHRDAARAVSLARRAVAIAPTFRGVRPVYTLALAQYRAGNLTSARAELDRLGELREDGDAYAMFLRAMLLARGRDFEGARRRFDEATRWMTKNRFGDFELHFLRDEAAALLR